MSPLFKKMSLDMFFRDPYMLDFLGLKDTYSEKDLENAILAELEKFILEMGSDFAFFSMSKTYCIRWKRLLYGFIVLSSYLEKISIDRIKTW